MESNKGNEGRSKCHSLRTRCVWVRWTNLAAESGSQHSLLPEQGRPPVGWRQRFQLHTEPRYSKTTRQREKVGVRSEEHTSELQSPCNLVCRLLPEKKKTETRQAS